MSAIGRIKNFTGLVAILLLASGCVTLSPDAKKIYMVDNSQEVSACTRIGQISTKSMACVDPPTCMNAAANEGRNKAAKMGATHLLATYNGVTLTHGIFDGYAYKCAEKKVGVQRMELITPNEINPSAGCTKDIECKGNRICESGQCMAP